MTRPSRHSPPAKKTTGARNHDRLPPGSEARGVRQRRGVRDLPVSEMTLPFNEDLVAVFREVVPSALERHVDVGPQIESPSASARRSISISK